MKKVWFERSRVFLAISSFVLLCFSYQSSYANFTVALLLFIPTGIVLGLWLSNMTRPKVTIWRERWTVGLSWLLGTWIFLASWGLVALAASPATGNLWMDLVDWSDELWNPLWAASAIMYLVSVPLGVAAVILNVLAVRRERRDLAASGAPC